MTWVGSWQTTDNMEKQLLHSFPPSLPLLPKLEFVLFTQLCRNLQEQEVHVGLSALAENVREERERGRDAQNEP